MTLKLPKKPFEPVFSNEEWAELRRQHGLRHYERRAFDELGAFCKVNTRQKSAAPSLPPAKTKRVIRKLREGALTRWTALSARANAMTEQQSADIHSAVTALSRVCEKTEAEIPDGRPGPNPEALRATISFLNAFLILQTGKKIIRTDKDKTGTTQDLAIAFFKKVHPELEASTIKNAIKEYLPGSDVNEARYLFYDDDKAFNRNFIVQGFKTLFKGYSFSPEGLRNFAAVLGRTNRDAKEIADIVAALGAPTSTKAKR